MRIGFSFSRLEEEGEREKPLNGTQCFFFVEKMEFLDDRKKDGIV